MHSSLFLSFFAILPLFTDPLIDLEDFAQDYVLETKQIILPDYPLAFNPGIIRWQNSLLLSFRTLPDEKDTFSSQLGLVWLDDNFNPISEPQLLSMRDSDSNAPCRAEDARLIEINQHLYIVYSDNPEPQLTRGGFRVYISQLNTQGGRFTLDTPLCLGQFEGEEKTMREKNWVPFDWMGYLFLAYSINPHKILAPHFPTGHCDTLAETIGNIHWPWGELRGGTPALRIGDQYLSFFHSSKRIETVHSHGRNMLHYLMGAYTFSADYPFEITAISPEPIIGKNFYRGMPHPTYKNWSSMRGVFPCGYVMDSNFIWVVYGKQDHELWVANLDRTKLLNTLLPVSPGDPETRD
ncbi:MAG: hypothetical protein KGJ02_03530 [Verrucomicrobiota bacterium]|nr:hypothetical protein [Verrucomicrobiota bacterium]